MNISGWAIEKEDGRIEAVQNLATAKWMVLNDKAVRVWDTINRTPVKIS